MEYKFKPGDRVDFNFYGKALGVIGHVTVCAEYEGRPNYMVHWENDPHGELGLSTNLWEEYRLINIERLKQG